MKNNRVLALFLCLVFTFSFLFMSSEAVYADNEKSSHIITEKVSDPGNDYLSITVSNDARTSGRFTSGTEGKVTGKSYELLYGWPNEIWSSFTTIRVDKKDYIFGQSVGGSFIKNPTDENSLANETVWKVGGIEITQRLEIVNNPITGRKDTGMYKYIVKNTDAQPHEIGTRILFDTQLKTFDGGRFKVPGDGEITKESAFAGSSIPSYYQITAAADEPDVMARGTLIGEGVTRPDKFAICNWDSFYKTTWDYEINGNTDLKNDRSVGIWWNPTAVQPGDSREFVTYYGLVDISKNSTLNVTGPSELEVEDNEWAPFTVTASFSQSLEGTLKNVSVDLILPEGLKLASSEDKPSRVIPSVEPGKTVQVSWEVIAVKAGTWDYTINAFTGTDLKKTGKGTVLVPELEVLPDATPPTTTITSNPVPNGNGWSNTDVKVILSSIDNRGGSGVDKISYNITSDGQTQNKEFQGSSVEFTLNTEGITRIDYWATDKATNPEALKTVEYRIDKTKPAVNINTLKTDYNKLTDTLEIAFSAADEGSGLDQVEAYLGDVKVENGQKIQLSKIDSLSGNQQLKVSAKDRAGNITVKTLDIFIHVPSRGFTLSPETLTLEIGKTYTLTLNFDPENTTEREVLWSSSNAGIARIENGKVTAVKPGEAIITVTSKDGLYRDTCNVKVIDKAMTLPQTGSSLSLLQPLGIILILSGMLMAFKRKPQCK